MSYFIDVFGLELYMLVGSAAAPFLFVDLFSSQAKGKIAGVYRSLFLILGILIFEHWNIIREITSGQPLTQPIILELGFGLVVPVVILLSILTSSRPLAFIGAIGAIATTVYTISVIETLDLVMGQQVITVIRISEILYGLGLFIGLIGVKKVAKT